MMSAYAFILVDDVFVERGRLWETAEGLTGRVAEPAHAFAGR